MIADYYAQEITVISTNKAVIDIINGNDLICYIYEKESGRINIDFNNNSILIFLTLYREISVCQRDVG